MATEIARLDAILSGRLDSSFVQSFELAKKAFEKFGKAGESAAAGVEKTFKAFGTTALEVGSELITTLAPIAAVGLAITAISAAITEYQKKAKEAAERQKEFNQAMGQAAGKLNAELTILSSLIAVARDHSKSLKTRNNAIDEANKLYPGYLGNINAENINSQQAAEAIRKLTIALKNKAEVQAYSNLLAKTTEQLFETQNSTLEDNIGFLDELKSVFTLLGGQGKVASSLIESGLKNQADKIKLITALVDQYSHSLADLTRSQAEGNEFKLLDPDKAAKTKQAIEGMVAALRDLPDPFKRFGEMIAVETGDATANVQASLDKNPLEFKFKPFPETEGFDKFKAQMNEAITIAQTLGDAFGQVFTELASGGKNAFKVLEQAIVGLISKLVAAVVEAIILSVILNALGFGGKIAGGAGVGNLLSQLLGGGLQFHAEGGIFNKPTQIGNHVFGERGPEALIPLDRLSQMMQGVNNTQRVEVVGRISGNDIVLVANRQNLKNLRNYGLNFNG